MNKKKKDFFQELRDRNVWREIKAYLFGGATIMSLVFLLYESGFIELEEFKLVLIIFFSLFPSVLLFAYHHGESRKAPWSKAEKIGIPLNVTVVFFLVFFYNNNAGATETTIELIENLETGELEEIEVVKKEYRKKLYLSFFENNSHDSEINWLGYGIPNAIIKDLQQDKYIDPNLFLKWDIEKKDESYKYGDKVSFSTYRQIAKEKLIPYFIKGSFTKINNEFNVTTNICITKTGKSLKERHFQNNNFFKLIDEISISIKEDLGLSTGYIETAEDLPVSAYLTESLLAYKYYIKSIIYQTPQKEGWLSKKTDQHRINLLNKAINIDNDFALAYNFCLHKYRNLPDKDSVELYWKKVMGLQHKFPQRKLYEIKYDYYMKQGKGSEAIRLIKNWAIRYPDVKTPHAKLAAYYSKRGEHKLAIDEYKKILSIDDTDYKYYSRIAYQYNKINDFYNELKWRKKAAKTYKEDSHYLRDIGYVYYQARQLDSATFYYQEALNIDPSDMDLNSTLYDLAITANGEWIKKINDNYLLEYVKTAEDSIHILSAKGNAYRVLGMMEKAEELSDSISKMYDKIYPAVADNDIGIEMEQHKENTKNLWKLLEKGEKDKADRILKMKEVMLYKIEKQSDKYGDFNQVLLSWFEASEITRTYMHDLYQKDNKEQIEKYVNYLEKKEEENKNDHTARFFIDYEDDLLPIQAKLHALNDEYDKAITLLEKHKYIGSSNNYIIQLARYYHKINNYKKAEENFNLIFITDPYDPKLNYYTALLYHDWGKIEKAEEHLKITLDTWKNADKDYVLANMAKTTAQEWNIEILN